MDLVSAEVVDVFHHQVPHWQARIDGSAFEHLDVQCFVCLGDVAAEFAHLIYLSVIGVFVGHGEYFVGVECALDGYVAQAGVEGVLVGGEQACALDFS